MGKIQNTSKERAQCLSNNEDEINKKRKNHLENQKSQSKSTIYFNKIKEDPKRYEEYRAKRRKKYIEYIEKLKKDPEKFNAFRAKKREIFRKHKEKVKNQSLENNKSDLNKIENQSEFINQENTQNDQCSFFQNADYPPYSFNHSESSLFRIYVRKDEQSKKNNLEKTIINLNEKVKYENSKKINFHNIEELAKSSSISHNTQLLDIISYNVKKLN